MSCEVQLHQVLRQRFSQGIEKTIGEKPTILCMHLSNSCYRKQTIQPMRGLLLIHSNGHKWKWKIKVGLLSLSCTHVRTKLGRFRKCWASSRGCHLPTCHKSRLRLTIIWLDNGKKNIVTCWWGLAIGEKIAKGVWDTMKLTSTLGKWWETLVMSVLC